MRIEETALPRRASSVRGPAEAINYDVKRDRSVWGEELDGTKSFIEGANLCGTWLNLCCGDGRYNSVLLNGCDQVIALDYDLRAMHRLIERAPEALRGKLTLERSDITQPLPFKDASLDGCVMTATIHMFPLAEIARITAEIKRVVRPGGQFVVDFATDIQRLQPDGTLYHYPNEARYTLDEGRRAIFDQFPDCEYVIREGECPPIDIDLGFVKVVFTSRGFVTRITLPKGAVLPAAVDL